MHTSLANILLVDDEPNYLKDALPLYGYKVEVAQDGIQALNKIYQQKNAFDLIILDVCMPNMDGWQVLKNLRNNKDIKYIPVIMLTGIEGDDKEVTSLKIGADDYINKPFKLPILLAHIEAVLRRNTRTRESFASSIIIQQNGSDTEYKLSDREKEILTLVAKGESNQSIAQQLSIQEVTVKTHLKNIFKKLNVNNRIQATVLALKINLI
jgi:two-component system alkaline phosphatase synthesis response regulator PhoP